MKEKAYSISEAREIYGRNYTTFAKVGKEYIPVKHLSHITGVPNTSHTHKHQSQAENLGYKIIKANLSKE